MSFLLGILASTPKSHLSRDWEGGQGYYTTLLEGEYVFPPSTCHLFVQDKEIHEWSKKAFKQL